MCQITPKSLQDSPKDSSRAGMCSCGARVFEIQKQSEKKGRNSLGIDDLHYV